MESSPYYDLLQPFVASAKEAAERGTYNAFLLLILKNPGVIWSKYLYSLERIISTPSDTEEEFYDKVRAQNDLKKYRAIYAPTEMMWWDNRCAIFNSFRKFLKRPEGKGWCFDFENCRWFRIRKLTPRECFRLMDAKENDIDKLMKEQENPKKGTMEQIISNSQLYKCAGNSIVVAPMALCFKNLFFPEQAEIPEGTQLSLF